MFFIGVVLLIAGVFLWSCLLCDRGQEFMWNLKDYQSALIGVVGAVLALGMATSGIMLMGIYASG